jgi:ABC-type phosphate transport system substrate-binding protein
MWKDIQVSRVTLHTLRLSLVLPIFSCLLNATSVKAQVSSTYGPFPCVSVDPRANATSTSSNAFTVSPKCQQYFGAGAAFPALLVRREADYFGIAIPGPISGQPGANGIQQVESVNPFTTFLGYTPSPTMNIAQYNYCSTNSGNGKTVFLGTTVTPASCTYTGSTSGSIVTPSNPGTTSVQSFPTASTGFSPLFAFTDLPLESGELSTYATNKLPTRGNPIQIPIGYAPVNIGVNPGVASGLPIPPGYTTPQINLSTLDVCRIFDGTYTNFNQLQGTAGLPNLPIKVIVNSAISGMTYAVTNYLASTCKTLPEYNGTYYLTSGVSVLPSVPQTANFVRKDGNDAVADAVATTTGGLGYISSDYTAGGRTSLTTTSSGAPLPINVFGSFHGGNKTYLINSSLIPNSQYPCVLTLSNVPNSFPIISLTYALLYSRYATQAERDAVKGIFDFMTLNTYPGNSSMPNNSPATVNDNIANLQTNFFLLRTASASAQPLSFPNTNAWRATIRACVNAAVAP